MSDTEPGLRELLRLRDFRWIYGGQVVSDFGDALTILSLLILVQRLGGSELHIAGIIIAATLPALIIGLLSGVYVDRWDRRRIMIVSDSVRAVIVLGFIAVRSLDLLWFAYLLAFTQAGIGTMFNPARAALTAGVVPERSLLAANSVSQTSRIVFQLFGTATAGILVELTGVVWPAFLLDSATFAASAILISLVAVRSTRQRTQKSERDPVWPELRAGVQLLTRSRGMRGLLLATTVALLGLGAVNVLFVPFVVGELGASEAWLGAIEGSQVVAMIIAGAGVAVLSKRLSVNLVTGGGLVIIGIAVAGVVLVHTPWQMMIVLFVAGLGVTPVQASVATLAQTLVEPELIGRSSAALNSTMSAASVASMGLAGAFATAIGIRNVFVIAGVISVTAGLVAYWLLSGVEASRTPATTPSPAPTPSPTPAQVEA